MELKPTEQIKSKKRVADHGEVFTNPREVNAMLDLVKDETERIDARFLEPACGNGNFLAEVLRRKLAVVNTRFAKSQYEWEYDALTGIAAIYGVDLLEDNARECRERLYALFEESYKALFPRTQKPEMERSIRYVLSRNILQGDALDFRNPATGESLVFSEWTPVGNARIQRRDYVFKFLVEKTHQFSLFNDQDGAAADIDKPVREFPTCHYLKLADRADTETLFKEP